MMHVSEVSSTYELIHDSVIVDTRTVTDLYGMELFDTKMSVNSGSFTPGEYRINPYSVSRAQLSVNGACSVEYDTGWWVYRAHDEGDIFYYALKDAEGHPLQMPENMEARAIQGAYSNIQKADLALGEAIGELRETLQMLRDPLRNLRDFLANDSYKNLNLLQNLARLFSHKSARAYTADQISAYTSTWLELRYGLRPLVMMVQDAIEMVGKAKNRGFNPRSIRAAKSNLTKTVSDSYETNFGYGFIAYEAEVNVELTKTVYCTVNYKQTAPDSTTEQLGLSLPYLPEVAWELTRLSFVVDWLYTIGPWLSSLRIRPNITVLGNTVGVKLEKRASVKSCRAKYSAGGAPWSEISPGCFYYSERYDRTCNVAMPNLPQFTAGDIIDLWRSVDALALIWQQIR